MEKIKKISGDKIADVVMSFFVDSIIERINIQNTKKIARGVCMISFKNKTNVYYPKVILQLRTENEDVIRRFHNAIAEREDEYDPKEIENAKRMLVSKTHRQTFCDDNYIRKTADSLPSVYYVMCLTFYLKIFP